MYTSKVVENNQWRGENYQIILQFTNWKIWMQLQSFWKANRNNNPVYVCVGKLPYSTFNEITTFVQMEGYVFP